MCKSTAHRNEKDDRALKDQCKQAQRDSLEMLNCQEAQNAAAPF